MNCFKTNNLAVTMAGASGVALLTVLTILLALPQSGAQAMQKGVSVELAPTSSAVPVPDADNQDAVIITVTDTGKIYFGVDLLATKSLGEMLKNRVPPERNVYLKVDARAPYANVVRILDVAHASGLTNIALLTTQGKTSQPGKLAVPEGIELTLARRTTAATE